MRGQNQCGPRRPLSEGPATTARVEAGNNDDRKSEPKMNYDLLLTGGEYCTVVIYITTP